MRANTRLITVITVAAVLVAIAIALSAIYLLVVGGISVRVETVPYGQPMPQPMPPGTVVRRPYQPAVIPLLAAALLIIGLLTKRLSIAWVGVALLFLFSGMFMFSWGLAFLPGAVLLLVLLFVIRAARRMPGRGVPG